MSSDLHVSSHQRWVHGVDFSGAVDAGRKIWIASGIIEGSTLHIKECRRAETLPCSSRERDLCLAALLNFIVGEGKGVFGFDFPFGLPAALVKKDRWEDFVVCFPDTFSSPGEFRRICLQAAGGSELKRITDLEHHTPFSPYNLRLYRQTYFGIRDVIAPLVRRHMACVLPMQLALDDKPWIVEICPAATLKKENVYRSYKGKSEEHYAARAVICEKFEGLGFLNISNPALRSAVLDDQNGDALDSVIAAVAALQALHTPVTFNAVKDTGHALEGYVYV